MIPTPETQKALAALIESCGEGSPIAAACVEGMREVAIDEQRMAADGALPTPADARALTGAVMVGALKPATDAARQPWLDLVSTPAQSLPESLLKFAAIILLFEPFAAVLRDCGFTPVSDCPGNLLSSATYDVVRADAERVTKELARRVNSDPRLKINGGGIS